MKSFAAFVSAIFLCAALLAPVAWTTPSVAGETIVTASCAMPQASAAPAYVEKDGTVHMNARIATAPNAAQCQQLAQGSNLTRDECDRKCNGAGACDNPATKNVCRAACGMC